MSNSNFHDEKLLEELANEIFRAAPGQNLPPSKSYEHPIDLSSTDHNDSFDLDKPQTSHKDTFIKDQNIPKAVSGDGSSDRMEKRTPETVWNEDAHVVTAYNSNNYTTKKSNSADDPHFRYQKPSSDNTSFTNINQYHSSNQIDFSSPKNIFSFESLHDLDLDLQVDSVKFNTQLPQSDLVYYFNSYTSPLEKSIGSSENTNFNSSRFDVEAVRKDFPILNEHINGRRLVWFDNAATTQKPQSVIDRLTYFYAHENSNIHRAAHKLAERATDAYEHARSIVKRFINASSTNEIVFTRGTTESINLVAQSWGEQNLNKDDEIIISHLEHHANIVPWQLLCKKIGFKIKVIPVNDQGEILLDEYAKLLTEKTKLVSFTHVSNALGTITPAKQIIDLAHQAGAKVLLDGAQSISHIKVDLQYLNPDFFVFSGHKIFGPTGIGVLYGKEELLNQTKPYQGGGNMIKDVTFERTIFHAAPNRFEAGTGNIADAVGLGTALEYVEKIGLHNIERYEHELLDYGTKLFREIPNLSIIGTADQKASVLSFSLKNYANEEVGKILNNYGIAVRTGHHCAQPILRRLGHESSIRPSFAFYNTFDEIDLLAKIIRELSQKR